MNAAADCDDCWCIAALTVACTFSLMLFASRLVKRRVEAVKFELRRVEDFVLGA